MFFSYFIHNTLSARMTQPKTMWILVFLFLILLRICFDQVTNPLILFCKGIHIINWKAKSNQDLPRTKTIVSFQILFYFIQLKFLFILLIYFFLCRTRSAPRRKKMLNIPFLFSRIFLEFFEFKDVKWKKHPWLNLTNNYRGKGKMIIWCGWNSKSETLYASFWIVSHTS